MTTTAAPPELIGPYEVLAPLAAGGLGVVYRVRDVRSGEALALKTLRGFEPGDLESLRREIHTLRRVNHPGVVRIVSEGVAEGVPWYAMELVEGATFDAWWRARRAAGGAAFAELARTLRRLCAALAFVHGEGIVHRDLKPANVIVREDGSPILVDFGFVAQFAAHEAREALEAGGELFGTLAYMAPEQIRGDYVDPRADLYSLGCMLYEAVTGDPPFTGEPWEVVAKHLRQEPTLPSQRGAELPEWLDALIARLLAKEPRQRLGYASDLAAALPPPTRAGEVSPGRAYLYRAGFAGREDSLARIRECWSGASAGRGAMVLVGGESGAGKTRLAMEVTRRANAESLQVVVGACRAVSDQRGAVGRPLEPLRPLLRTIADHCLAGGDELTRRVLGARGRLLAPLEPGLAALPGHDEHPEPAEVPPQAARERLLTALRETALAFAQETPLLLVIDDLQWADELTLALLSSLHPGILSEAPLLVLGTFRSEEKHDALARLCEAPQVQRLDLERMDVETVECMVSDMLAMHPAPGSLVRFLSRVSEGNPFFVGEYLRTAVGAQLLERTARGHWRVAGSGSDGDADYEHLDLPNTIQDLVERRLLNLAPGSRRLLECGAVLGREFDPLLAANLAGADEATRLDAVSELVARVILEPAAGGQLRFVHDKLREVAYAGSDHAWRRHAHRAAAEALEARPEAEASRPYAELAHHWSRAGVEERALDCLGWAGQQALANGAHREARELLGRALESDARLGHTTPAARRARWLRMLGEACFGVGQLESALQHMDASLQALGHRIPGRDDGWTRLLLTEGLRWLGHQLWPPRPHRQPLRREAAGEASLTANQLATTFYYTSGIAPAGAMLLRALRLAEHAGDARVVAESNARLAFITSAAGLHGRGRHLFERSAKLARAHGDERSLALGLYLQAMVLTGVGEWARCRALGNEALALLERIGDPQDAEIARTVVGNAIYYEGRLHDSAELFRLLLELAERRSNAQHIGWGHFLLGRSLLALGRAGDAVEHLERGQAPLRPLPDVLSSVMCEGSLARGLIHVGRRDDARRVARALAERLNGRLLTYAPCLDGYVGLADTWLALWEHEGDDEARRAARQACADLRRFALAFPIARPAARRCTGREHALRGHASRARRHFQRALARAEALAMPLEADAARSALARAA